MSKETIRDIHNIWDRLEDNPARADLAEGQILHQPVIGKEGARIGIDSKFRFHIILQPKDPDEEFNRKLTNDIHIKTKEINIEGTASIQVNIIAGKRWRHAIEPFAAEVIDSMVNGSVSLSTLRNLVEEYRSLWASPKEPLNPRKQRGIIAELKVLEDLGKFIGHAQSMQKWSGSLSSKSGGLHDIGDEIFAIEVKSYHEEPPRVRINGIEQLDHRIDKRLTLIGVHIISHQDGMTLPGYIDHCLKIYEEAGCKSVAEEKLNLAGWRDSDREEYHSKFTIGRTVIVPIRPDTPVFPAHLKDRIPSSVSGISYLLHLNDLHALPSDKENSWKEMVLEEPWPMIDDQSLTSESLISNNCKEIHALPQASKPRRRALFLEFACRPAIIQRPASQQEPRMSNNRSRCTSERRAASATREAHRASIAKSSSYLRLAAPATFDTAVCLARRRQANKLVWSDFLAWRRTIRSRKCSESSREEYDAVRRRQHAKATASVVCSQRNTARRKS